jgi:hypothetical protein
MKNAIIASCFVMFGLTPIIVGQHERQIGDHFDLVATANEGDFSCIVKFESLGQRDIGESNCWIYIGAEVSIEKQLFSRAIERQKINFSQLSFPEERAEQLPEIGKLYLAVGFFYGDKSLSIRKLTEPTPENIKIVEDAAIRRGIQSKLISVTPEEEVNAGGAPGVSERAKIADKGLGNDGSQPVSGIPEERNSKWLFGGGLLILLVALLFKVRSARRTSI